MQKVLLALAVCLLLSTVAMAQSRIFVLTETPTLGQPTEFLFHLDPALTEEEGVRVRLDCRYRLTIGGFGTGGYTNELPTALLADGTSVGVAALIVFFPPLPITRPARCTASLLVSPVGTVDGVVVGTVQFEASNP